jgi:hypothetical protein
MPRTKLDRVCNRVKQNVLDGNGYIKKARALTVAATSSLAPRLADHPLRLE